jgi:carboxypeptidase family protein
MKAEVVLFLSALTIGTALAQTPTGTIAGIVRDPSGAVVAGVQVHTINMATGFARDSVSSGDGNFSLPALLAGEYQITAEFPGFQKIVRTATVEAGGTTTVDLDLRFGDVRESITASAASPQINFESAAIGGLITRDQIEDLPLNGRSFLELAKLEPGVQPPTRGSNNRTFVPVLGAPQGNNGRGTRVTVDGGSIMAVGNGGSAMAYSQEVVQEFQTSSVNLDLSTGITDSGAVNVVTRSGGNDLHGTAFYFFRDHNLSAYPGLKRDPANPDPFFQRRQFGFAAGGPLLRNRVFFFGTWERNEQRGVVATTLATPDFAQLSRITASPSLGDQLSSRFDVRLSDRHTLFLRYSHDGSGAYSPSSLFSSGDAAYPSQWTRQSNWADQSVLGLTSVFRPALVNEFRFSYFFISSKEIAPTSQDCADCIGLGAPTINITQANLFIGNATASYNLGRRFHLNDSATWQKGAHRARFGVDGEHNRGGLIQWMNEPATLTLYSPAQVRTYNASPQTQPDLKIPLPASFTTLDDILQLPLQTATITVGNPRVPQEGGGLVRNWNTLRLFFQDTWRVRRQFTVNYGLGWSIDRNLNFDLRKPVLLAPLFGYGGLGTTRKQWKNFSPSIGLAWAPSADGNTVIRAGSGIFYDFLFPPNLDAERAALGAPNLGRQTFSGTSIPNPLEGIAGVPIGRPLDFRALPTLFTGVDLISILPAIRASLLQKLSSADPSVQAIQVTKQLPSQFGSLWPADVPIPSSLHVSAGLQRKIAQDFVVSADVAYRHFIHLGLSPSGIDLNHFNSTHGPVIQICSAAQRSDPQALCSTGAINVQESAARATYKGLLLKAKKRFSHGFQLLGSYAFSRNTGTNTANGFNLDNWLANRGPLPTDLTHILNVAGVTRLPDGFGLSFNFSYSSAAPFSAFLGGIDLNGDGTTNDLLPGTTVNAFNRSMGRADLGRLVAQFNQSFANAGSLQGLTLPAQYSFGRSFHSLDVRLSRSFAFGERWSLSLMGEAFNLYNNANLSGYSGDLTSPAFGQPTSRLTQIFGSEGPRAFQFGTKVRF